MNLVPRFLAQAPNCLKHFLGGNVGGDVQRTSAVRWHSCAILRINLSHDLPHSLGQACRGVDTTAAGRLFFKPI
jgi:hypothetical protein